MAKRRRKNEEQKNSTRPEHPATWKRPASESQIRYSLTMGQ
jgi:hypothetical protein